jgi:hypothetical protein
MNKLWDEWRYLNFINVVVCMLETIVFWKSLLYGLQNHNYMMINAYVINGRFAAIGRLGFKQGNSM